LRALTLTVDSTVIYQDTWAKDVLTETLWATTWQPAGEGVYGLQATVTDWDGNTASDTVTTTVDLLPPTVAVTPTLLTRAHYHQPRRLDVSGVATDTQGVADVHVSVDGYDLGAAALSLIKIGAGGERVVAWHVPWYLRPGPLPDGTTYAITATVTDIAGRSTGVSDTLTVDVVPPASTTLSLSSNGAGLAPGDTVRAIAPTLTLTWTASSDGSALGDYTVEWTTQLTPSLTTVTSETVAPGAQRTSDYLAGDGQKLHVQLGSQDVYGQETWQSFGPVYVDSPQTPDYVPLADLDGVYRGWMESGCTLIGVDRRIARNASPLDALNAEQKLYATWNAEALRLAWTGANWTTDGDLFIYLDTKPVSGTSQVFNPYPVTPDTEIYLPGKTPSGEEPGAMKADFLIWVQDAATAVLLSWDGSDWIFDRALSVEQFQFDAALSAEQTDLYIPFDMIGFAGHGSLDLLAFATEEDALRLWAVMPSANPVNSARVVETTGFAGESQEFAFTRRYHWDSLDAGLCPNGSDGTVPTEYLDTDVQVHISAEPVGTAYSFVGDNLFWLWGMLLENKLADVTTFFDFLTTDPATVAGGQVISYTIHYRNRGTDVARGVYVDAKALHDLNLVGGGQVVNLPDIGPGESGSATFTGTVAAVPSEGWAALEAKVCDASGKPLDWVWIDHQVDLGPPEFFGIQQPEYLVAAGINHVTGYAYDDAGVPLIKLYIQPGPSQLACPDTTPQDGSWLCVWDTTGSHDGDVFHVQLQAKDGFGQLSALSNPQPFVVDTVPPTVTLDEAASTVIPGSVVAGGTHNLVGHAVDNRGLERVEACLDGACAPTNLSLLDAATAAVYEDATAEAIDDSTVCGGAEISRNFDVTESFPIGQVTFGFNAEHPHRDDIQVELRSPSGTVVRLLYDDGLGVTDFANYDLLLNDAVISPYSTAHDDDPSAPYYDRDARPYQPLRAFNGEISHGLWTVTICDLEPSTNNGTYHRSKLVLKPQSTAAPNGDWSYALSIPDREDYVQHTLSIYGVDQVGNRTAPPLDVSFIVDDVAPLITVDDVVTQMWWGRTETVLSGTVSDGGQVSTAFVTIQEPSGRIYDERLTPQGDAWSYDLHARLVGPYTLWVVTGDAVGNASTAGPFVVDSSCIGSALSATLIAAEPTAGTPFSVTLTIVVSNTAGAEVPAGVPVGVYAGDLHIGTATTAQPLAPGQSETLVVIWQNSYRGTHDIRMVPNDVATGVRALPFCSMQTTAHQTLSLLEMSLIESWNLVSSYIDPFNNDTAVVQRPIAGRYVVILGFDQGAQSYYPGLPPGLNTLLTMDAEHGYWIKMVGSQAAAQGVAQGLQMVAALQVVGEELPEDHPIPLDAGWNLVSYLPRKPLTLTVALQSIAGLYTAVLGYEPGVGALSCYPDLDPTFNTLQTMKPGYGYWVKMSQAATLQYPVTPPGLMAISDGPAAVGAAERAGAQTDVTTTNTWVNFYGPAKGSDGAPLPVGTTVTAIDPDGVTCGAMTVAVEGQYGLLPCYGDDPTTPEDEGAQAGDAIVLVIERQIVGRGTWTSHGERQRVILGSVEPGPIELYLPLIVKAAWQQGSAVGPGGGAAGDEATSTPPDTPCPTPTVAPLPTVAVSPVPTVTATLPASPLTTPTPLPVEGPTPGTEPTVGETPAFTVTTTPTVGETPVFTVTTTATADTPPSTD
jgi:subtilisin-like proprotein convertase family protein